MFVSKELFLDAGLYAWGSNGNGQLGVGNTAYYSSPVQVGSLTNWKQVSSGGPGAGSSYICTAAVNTIGQLWTWGTNVYGQLGIGASGNYYSSPVQVGTLNNWKQVSASGWGIASIKTDGTLWVWGSNSYGQLGQGNTTYYSSPVQVGALNNWKQVSIGGAEVYAGGQSAFGSTAAVKTDGTLWAWGSNAAGQLGQNYAGNYYSSPIQIGALTNWKEVSVGTGFMLSIKTDGTLWAWGSNGSGQLGIGNQVSYSSPVQIGALTSWKQVSASTNSNHTFAIKNDGTLWAWGQNNYGQLGTNNTTYYSSPVQVGNLTNWKQVSAGYRLGVALKTDGTIWTWGWNLSGPIGIGVNSATVYYSSPVQVGALTSWKQIAAGEQNVLAISAPDLP
jgi:alpha-tubulin suppressor-like RCC1 family protein